MSPTIVAAIDSCDAFFLVVEEDEKTGIDIQRVTSQVLKMIERTDEKVFVADVWRERIWKGSGCMCAIVVNIGHGENFVVEVIDDEEE